MQHDATQCNALQHTATVCVCSVLWRHRDKRRESRLKSNVCLTLQHTAMHFKKHCKVLQYNATHCNTLQHTATHCNSVRVTLCVCQNVQKHVEKGRKLRLKSKVCLTLQDTATHYNTTQHAATHCNTVCVQELVETRRKEARIAIEKQKAQDEYESVRVQKELYARKLALAQVWLQYVSVVGVFHRSRRSLFACSGTLLMYIGLFWPILIRGVSQNRPMYLEIAYTSPKNSNFGVTCVRKSCSCVHPWVFVFIYIFVHVFICCWGSQEKSKEKLFSCAGVDCGL